MPRDNRYKNVKDMITDGRIKLLREMFDREVIPKSVVGADLGMNNTRITDLIHHVDEFRLREIFMIGKFIGIDEDTVLKLIMEQYYLDKKKNKP